jgi:hypothetical protein
MNKLQKIITASVLLMAMYSQFVAAQTIEPLQTVKDYYLAIPNIGLLEDQCNFFLQNRTRANIAPTDFRKSLIKTEDIQNGYLRLEPPNSKDDDGGEVSLFKKKDGSTLLGIADWHGNLACKSIAFLEFKNGKWHNVTKRYEKKIIKQRQKLGNKKQYLVCYGGYSFGQQEKSVKVTCMEDIDSERSELIYLWNGKDFMLQNKK